MNLVFIQVGHFQGIIPTPFGVPLKRKGRQYINFNLLEPSFAIFT
jgi:hypothetical protein